MTKVHIHRLDKALPLPRQATTGSAGLDLISKETFVLDKGTPVAVPTGIQVAIPPGFEGQVRPRSGLALKGIIIPNSPGTIDSDYRGEVKVLLLNLASAPITIERGQRIAQLILSKFDTVEWEESEQLERTERGSGGFGSTGK